MGIGKTLGKISDQTVGKLNRKVFGKKLSGIMDPVAKVNRELIRFGQKSEDKMGEWIAGKPPKAPDVESPATDVGEGGLESAAIQLGHKRKRLSLAKPTGRSASTAKTQGSGVGVQV